MEGRRVTLQEHLLDQLQEELAEAIQAISKAKRFGLYNFWEREQCVNSIAIQRELIDCDVVMAKIKKHGLLMGMTREQYDLYRAGKEERLQTYIEYAREVKRLLPADKDPSLSMQVQKPESRTG